ncbi:hypothetical protein [Mycobacterium sp.]|uniref:hypothetical protein n=1 Tax=Mycobacterium sp. TaxID=1785 RepID=UPI003F9B4127
MMFGRRKAVEMLVAQAKARKRAEAAGTDPDATPEAEAVEAAEAKLIAQQRRIALWAQRLDGGGSLSPRLPGALAEALAVDLRPIERD